MTKRDCIEEMGQWIYSRMPGKLASYDAGVSWAEELYDIAEKHLLSSKHPNHLSSKGDRQRVLNYLDDVIAPQHTVCCGTCGKPMEDRGAANQWCKECVDKRTQNSFDSK